MKKTLVLYLLLTSISSMTILPTTILLTPILTITPQGILHKTSSGIYYKTSSLCSEYFGAMQKKNLKKVCIATYAFGCFTLSGCFQRLPLYDKHLITMKHSMDPSCERPYGHARINRIRQYDRNYDDHSHYTKFCAFMNHRGDSCGTLCAFVNKEPSESIFFSSKSDLNMPDPYRNDTYSDRLYTSTTCSVTNDPKIIEKFVLGFEDFRWMLNHNHPGND